MVKEELKLDQRRKQRETTDVVFMFWLRFRNRSGGNVDKRRSFGIQFETKNVATLHRSTMILRLKRFGSRYNRITLEHSNQGVVPGLDYECPQGQFGGQPHAPEQLGRTQRSSQRRPRSSLSSLVNQVTFLKEEVSSAKSSNPSILLFVLIQYIL